MLMIICVPLVGILFALFINRPLRKTNFRGSDVLPFFFLPACNLLTNQLKKPTFLPYGFLFFFIFVIGLTISRAIKDKNISLAKTLHELWKYLSLCSIFWFLGLGFLAFL